MERQATFEKSGTLGPVLNSMFVFSSRRRHTRYWGDCSSDVCSSDLNQIFARQDGVVVSVQNPVRLDQGSEPEPDLAVLRADAPQDRPPGPADVLLVIEVADSSLDRKSVV